MRIERTLRHLRGELTQQPKPALVDKPLWTCPKCGHPFVTKNMKHSCTRHDLGEVFRNKPAHVHDEDPRFSKIETIATNVHVHRVKIRKLEELDDSVRRWIDRPYRVGCREQLR